MLEKPPYHIHFCFLFFLFISFYKANLIKGQINKTGIRCCECGLRPVGAYAPEGSGNFEVGSGNFEVGSGNAEGGIRPPASPSCRFVRRAGSHRGLGLLSLRAVCSTLSTSRKPTRRARVYEPEAAPAGRGKLPKNVFIDVYTKRIYDMFMKFEWDEKKNELNIRKHKIDFRDVQQVFDGPMIVNIDDRMDYGEVRWIGMGFLRNLIAVLVFIEKDDDTIHIISARKANKHESKIFTKEIKDGLG
jgi:uncharacterized DUF497 family protein